MDNYEQMGTAELRKLIRERGLGSGLALSSANKNECMALVCAWLVAPVAAQVWETIREGRADA